MPDFQEMVRKFVELERELFTHDHNGNQYRAIYVNKLVGEIPARVSLSTATIATTGNTDGYIIAPMGGVLDSVDFSGVDALAANDTNYITFSITNLGTDGTGTNALLAATDANTTKATGGTAISANTRRQLTLHGSNNLNVKIGDRLRIRAAVTNTLANTVTFPTYMLRFA